MVHQYECALSPKDLSGHVGLPPPIKCMNKHGSKILNMTLSEFLFGLNNSIPDYLTAF